MRIDKWLWAARFFKTRAMAARACELGRIEFNHQPVKPAREIRVGDMLQIRTEGGDYQVEVLVLSEIRGPAAVAQTLYRETDASREARLKAAEERKALKNFTPAPEGRPSKTRPAEDYSVQGRAGEVEEIPTLASKRRTRTWGTLALLRQSRGIPAMHMLVSSYPR